MLLQRLKRLYRQLLTFIPEVKLKHILGAAAFLMFGLLTGNASGQWFAPSQTNPFGLTNTYNWAFPTFVDIDADGDLDAFVGEYYGAIQYFENTGTINAPAFAAPQVNPFGLDSTYLLAFPTFVDIDADGDFDAFVGEYNGAIQYFENIGTNNAPAFAAPQTNPFGLISVQYLAAPTFVDIDADGDFDAFVGEYPGNIQFFENTGTNNAPVFEPPLTNPFGLSNVNYYAFPVFADLDGDGDFDAFVGEYSGNFLYFRNTGTINSPAFAAPQTNPFGITNVLALSIPFLVDIDADGDLDLFSGEYYGNLQFFENITVADDAGVIAVNSPASSCVLTSSENVTVTVQNFGSNPQSNIPVSYSINAGVPVTETIAVTLNPGDTVSYTFTATADLSIIGGTYVFDAWTEIVADGNIVNDSTANFLVMHKPLINTFPYIEDFESGNGGWISGGLNSVWQLGSPSGAVINSAASGANAWVTNLSGNYYNNDQSYMESPCFDLSNLTNPQVELQIWYDAEFGWDGAALLSSIDGGNAWQKIGTVGDTVNWYNDAGVTGLNWTGNGEGWSGASGDWLPAKHEITSLAGQPDVLFRMVFGSDGSVNNFDGVAIDDFKINEAPTGIEENSPVSDVIIYPNPSKGKFHIQISNVNVTEEITLEITNAIGQSIYKERVKPTGSSHTIEVNASGFDRGVYLVRFTSANETITRKLVIQ